ncbi:endonuclease VII domain-containing protein [Nocardia vinacea]|uniref:endonuclease VII domain-containing protein n=1 Tax=Nocardia vinacea TaxID=96468 RepID=UPI00341DF96C
MKPCTLCGGSKARFERGKLCPSCKPWASYARSLRRFGLTPADYTAILQAQGGVCFICSSRPGTKRLCIDHDHALPDSRAAVRGLLCDECNYSRLPRFADDPEMLKRAVAYLSSPPARDVTHATVSSSERSTPEETAGLWDRLEISQNPPRGDLNESYS